ncbi:MAG TPA: 16S rRNA (guanine(527)-N(7))-methyltransferase RsmG [Bacilli bacterium]|nr:16S rRNA (guanine(527)-N(7))-methyltransferase RsmG [Bacilli bacterium]
MNKEEFLEQVTKLGINLSIKKQEQLEEYYKLLIEYNSHTNLTAITAKEDVYLKHFYDSLCIIKIIDLNKDIKLCDIGTGAGFPGLVLKIVFPNLNITLIDSTRKKTIFLEEVIKKLDLKDIKVVTSRIEDYARSHEEEFDIVTARAVAKLNVLLELSTKMIKVKGSFIAMKADAEEELKESVQALRILDVSLDQVINYELPREKSRRSLIKIIKLKSTSKEYPRNFSKIKNKSL